MRSLIIWSVVLLMSIVGCNQTTDSVARTTIQPPSPSPKPEYEVPKEREIERCSFGDLTLFRPKTHLKKLPIVLFAPGWGSHSADDYRTLLRFIARQGYCAIYAPDMEVYSAQNAIERFETIERNATLSRTLDFSRFGVVGHSSGGGLAFSIFEHFSRRGWGSRGGMIVAMASWFAFGMDTQKLAQLPEQTHLLMVQFGEDRSTDPRIPLTLYTHTLSIPYAQKEYIVIPGTDHGYPAGSPPFDTLSPLLKPIDALMAYTFEGDQDAYHDALEGGSDDPVASNLQELLPSERYPYPCYGEGAPLEEVLQSSDIDYCHP